MNAFGGHHGCFCIILEDYELPIAFNVATFVTLAIRFSLKMVITSWVPVDLEAESAKFAVFVFLATLGFAVL